MIIKYTFLIIALLLIFIITFALLMNAKKNKSGGGDNEGDPDYSFGPYNKKEDDQQTLKIADEQQKHLNKSYKENVEWAFPIILARSYLPAGFKSPASANKKIQYEIVNGENKYWTNQTLSYMRKNIQGRRIIECIALPLINRILGRAKFNIIDTTANIGGATIQWALQPRTKKVISYEINEKTAALLKNNIELYKLGDKIELRQRRFDYDVLPQSIVLIDPPYESPSGPNSNFTLSIEPMPIYYVVEHILKNGAALVLLEVPEEFKYNKKYAADNGQHIAVFIIPAKKNKIYAISKSNKIAGRFLIYPSGKYTCKLVPTDKSRKTYGKYLGN